MHEDLIAMLEAAPARLGEAVVGSADATLDRAAPDEWSPRTVLAHLRDDEYLVIRQRLERMLMEEGPVLPDFDEKAWARTRNRDRDDTATLLADFEVQRSASVNILRSLSAEQWERTGTHEVEGAFTVRSWVEHWIEHDETHIEQIRRALT